MANLKTAIYSDFSGGLNDTSHESQLKANEASLLRNWDITYKGQLQRRDGLTTSGTFTGTNLYGLAAYLRSSGGKDLLAVADDTLKYKNGASWDSLDDGFTSGKDFAFATVHANEREYMCNEDNQIHYWDRGSVTLNSCLTDLGAAIPHGNSLIWHKNHMFTANNATLSGSTYTNRIYWSAMGDPDTWDTTNDFNDLPGGGRVMSLADWGDSLVIFKERAIMYLSGWGDADWRLTATNSMIENIDESVGTLSPKGNTRVGDEIWFIDDEAQIRRLYKTDYDAFRRDIISSKIQTTIASVNKAQLDKALAWTYNDKVFFAVPTGSSTYNDLVLVFDLIASKRTGEEAWTTYTGWSPDFAVTYPTSATQIDLYLADATNEEVFLHSGDDDDGTSIDARWDGRSDDYESPDVYKRYKFGYITGTGGVGNVEIYSAVDDLAFSDLGDLSLATTGGTLGPTGTFELGPTGTTAILAGSSTGDKKFYYATGGGRPWGKKIKHSLRHNVINQQPTVSGLTSHFKEKYLR